MKLRREDLPIALVLLLGAALNAVGLGWGLPNTMDWAIDSVAPYRVLQAAYFKFSGGWFDKYPPLHLMLLAVLYAPYLAYVKLTGGLGRPARVFPFGLAEPAETLGDLILIARVVSVVMALGIVVLIYRITRELFGRRAGVLAALVVTLNYPFVYYAHAANLEAPYLFWSLLAVLWYLRVLRRGALRDYLLFALFATLAVCTKDQAYGLFVLAPLAVLWARRREGARSEVGPPSLARLVADRRNLLAAALAAGTFALIHNLPLNLQGFLQHVRLITAAPEGYNAFPPTIAGRLQLLASTASFLWDGMTPPLFLACAAGAAVCAVRHPARTLPVLLLAFSYFVFFLNALLNMLPRFALPIAILLAPYGGKLLADLWDGVAAGAGRLARRGVVAAAFAYAGVFAVQLDLLFLNDPRYAAERWLDGHAPEGALVETFSPHAIHNYYPRFRTDLRVRSSWLPSGTSWDARSPRRERVQIPNLYMGREAPDFIVLSEFWYEQVLDPEERGAAGRPAMQDLFAGEMGYRVAADFRRDAWVPIRELRVSPRVVIFERAPVTEPRPR